MRSLTEAEITKARMLSSRNAPARLAGILMEMHFQRSERDGLVYYIAKGMHDRGDLAEVPIMQRAMLYNILAHGEVMETVGDCGKAHCERLEALVAILDRKPGLSDFEKCYVQSLKAGVLLHRQAMEKKIDMKQTLQNLEDRVAELRMNSTSASSPLFNFLFVFFAASVVVTLFFGYEFEV